MAASVLVIDDSFFQRKVVCAMVEELGFETIQAESGEKGLEMIQNMSPDFIIMDLLMPGISGKEVLKKLQKQGNKIPVMILSADIQESVKTKCIELGATWFLNKPPKKEQLGNCFYQV